MSAPVLKFYPMTPEQFRDRMERIAAIKDKEGAHGRADDLMEEVLRSLGYCDGCDIFKNMEKWYA